MFTSSTIAFAAALFASAGMAAPAPQASSAPAETKFGLTAVTTDGAIHPGGPVAACHEAAGTELFCVDGESGSQFSFSAGSGPAPAGYGSGAGNLTFNPYGNDGGAPYDQPLAFYQDPSGKSGQYGIFGESGVANAPIAFKIENDQLSYVLSNSDGTSTIYGVFWICPFQIAEGYNSFPTITFNYDSGAPNANCSETTIFRR